MTTSCQAPTPRMPSSCWITRWPLPGSVDRGQRYYARWGRRNMGEGTWAKPPQGPNGFSTRKPVPATARPTHVAHPGLRAPGDHSRPIPLCRRTLPPCTHGAGSSDRCRASSVCWSANWVPPTSGVLETSSSLERELKNEHLVTYEVPVTMIDQHWLQLGRPTVTLIKIDVEGHELPALRGATEIVSNVRPVLVAEVLGSAPMADLEALVSAHHLVDSRVARWNCWSVTRSSFTSSPGTTYFRPGRRLTTSWQPSRNSSSSSPIHADPRPSAASSACTAAPSAVGTGPGIAVDQAAVDVLRSTGRSRSDRHAPGQPVPSRLQVGSRLAPGCTKARGRRR